MRRPVPAHTKTILRAAIAPSWALAALLQLTPASAEPLEPRAVKRIDVAASTRTMPRDREERAAERKPAASSDASSVAVMIDNAKIIRLPDRTQTVIVGNPAIADVTTQRNGIVVVTGKSYGVTNLIALDGAGNLLAESQLKVQAPRESVVTVQRGLERESYSCTPNCQPSLLLGDANKYFGEVGGQVGQRNTLATQR